MSGKKNRLPTRVLLGYGAPALMLAAMSITFYIYLPKYYVDQLGFRLGALGVVILASRLWDAVTDPAVGWLSDRTRTRWGRRRPWILGAAVPLAISFFLISNPTTLGATELALGVLTFFFFLTWTSVTIPYESLGPEISSEYDERNRLFGVRETMVILGTIVAAALPAVLPPGSLGLTGYGAVGLVFGVVLIAGTIFCVTLVKERPLARLPTTTASPWKTMAAVLSNRPFAILLIAYSVYAFGGSLSTTVFLFFAEQVLGSDKGPFFLVLYLGTGVLFLPVWIWIAGRAEKKTAWIAALAVSGTAFAGTGFLGRGDEFLFGALVVLTGIGLGGIFAIPPSMQADTIDYDESLTGIRQEGQYVGTWALAKKLAMALGAGIALPTLGLTGYVAGGTTQSESAILTLRVLYVAIPCVCNFAAAAIVMGYPISRSRHLEITSSMAARQTG